MRPSVYRIMTHRFFGLYVAQTRNGFSLDHGPSFRYFRP